MNNKNNTQARLHCCLKCAGLPRLWKAITSVPITQHRTIILLTFPEDKHMQLKCQYLIFHFFPGNRLPTYVNVNLEQLQRISKGYIYRNRGLTILRTLFCSTWGTFIILVKRLGKPTLLSFSRLLALWAHKSFYINLSCCISQQSLSQQTGMTLCSRLQGRICG